MPPFFNRKGLVMFSDLLPMIELLWWICAGVVASNGWDE